MIPKPLHAILWSDIESLVTDGVSEGRTIEFKRELPKSSDDDKREFLADISSLANTLGGDLVYGVTESDGIAINIEGIPQTNLDSEQLRLEEIVRNGIDPRIPGVEMQSIPDSTNAKRVLIIRAHRSYSAPHMVVYKNFSRFFARNSKGKYQLDVREIKSAFLGAESTFEKIAKFRADRITRVLGGEPPVSLSDESLIFFHLIPLNPFRLDTIIENALRAKILSGLLPLGPRDNSRLNVDGVVTWQRLGSAASSYAQFFRSGTIETVASDIVRKHKDKKWLMIQTVLTQLQPTIAKQLELLRDLSVPAPFVLLTSLMGVKGTTFYRGEAFFGVDMACDRDAVFLPDLILEGYDVDLNEKISLIKDALGNAYGFERCPEP